MLFGICEVFVRHSVYYYGIYAHSDAVVGVDYDGHIVSYYQNAVDRVALDADDYFVPLDFADKRQCYSR